MDTKPFSPELIALLKNPAMRWQVGENIGETFSPKFIYYEPHTKVVTGGMEITYGLLPEEVRTAAQKRQLVEWLNSFLTEEEAIKISDLKKPDKFALENYFILGLSREGWQDPEIARFLCHKIGHISADAVKKRRQRLKNR